MKVNKMDYVTVIGAANVDILGFSTDKLIYSDSNPGQIKICSGGVGRNIAENLSRLNINTKMITILGDDMYGKRLFEECKQIGIDMDHCLIREGEITSTFTAVIENNGEMALALSDMSIIDRLPVDHLKEKSHIIERSKIIILDSVLPQNVIEYVLENFKNNLIFLDPVSVGKAKRVKELISGFNTIKLNKIESEYISDIKINGTHDLEKASRYFIDRGVERVFITLGKEGVYYRIGDYTNHYKPKVVEATNVIGAGDAFMAGVVYCTMNGKDIDYTAKFSSALSQLTLKSLDTVSQTISEDNVIKVMQEEE